MTPTRSVEAASKPLSGLRIAVTRPRDQAGAFADSLQRLGADVMIAPLIAIEDPVDPNALTEAARKAEAFDWIVFTSANAVERFWAALESLDAAPDLRGVAICAVGTATARALERQGAAVSLVPEEFIGERVVDALSRSGELRGRRILFARAEGARAVIADSLRELGAEVVEVVAYRTVVDYGSADALRAAILSGDVDVVTLTSSSAVNGLVEMIGANVGSVRIATIGPITSSTARAAGLPVHIEADPYTTDGLAAKIVEYYARRTRGAEDRDEK